MDEGGYCFMMAPCGSCGLMITFNPNYVPSLNNVPFCRACIDKANKLRPSMGLPPIKIHPLAYEPLPERELR